MAEIVLTAENFDAEVLKSDIPVLVDFWAAWCGPCRMLAPAVAAVAEKHAGEVKVGKVNVDEQGLLANRYGIASIPTVILFRNGSPVKRSVGLVPQAQLEALLS